MDPLWERLGCRLKHPVEIDCRTRVSKSIFKLTVARGCPGVPTGLKGFQGVSRGFKEFLRGFKGFQGVFEGFQGV